MTTDSHDEESSWRLLNRIQQVARRLAPALALVLAGQAFAGEDAGGSSDGLKAGLEVDRLEAQHSLLDQTNYHYWHADAWVGSDTNKFILKTEGAHAHGIVSGGLNQVLYGRAVSESWMLEAGIAHTGAPGPGLDWAAVAAEGELPFSIDSEWMLFWRSDNMWLRAQFERITELADGWKFVPKLEINFYSDSSPDNQIGNGLSNIELSLRLAYDFSKQVAGYVGYSRQQAFGNTAMELSSSDNSTYDNLLIGGLMISY